MKTKIALILAATLAVSSFTGCATTGANPPATAEQKAARLQTAAELAAFSGATVWLSKNPKDRPAFEAARSAIALIVAGSQATPAQLSEALAGLPIKELKGEEAAIYIGVATILYDAYLRENINIDGNVNVKAFATGLHAGLNRALLVIPAPTQ
jgi:hypothetical protein